MTDIERAKETVRRLFVEGIGQGRPEVVDECIAAAAVDDHGPEQRDARAHVKDVARGLHTAFPDLEPQITHIVGEGDTVAVRVLLRGTHDGPLHMPGMPSPVSPTGLRVEMEQFHVITLDGEGRGLHHWGATGADAVMRQLRAAQPGAV